jgi:hypothetical protein
MRSTTLKAKAECIADRARVVGYPDPATIELARNKGATRTNSKRKLLDTLAEETRLRARAPAFASCY